MKNNRFIAVAIPSFMFSAFNIIPFLGVVISFFLAASLILSEETSKSLKFVYLIIWALGVMCFSLLYVNVFYQEKSTLTLNVITGAIFLVIGLVTMFTGKETEVK